MSRKKTHEERLSDKYQLNDQTGCWEWTACTDPAGYGRVGWNEDGSVYTDRAHRLAYRTWVGDIPEGLKVLHTCDNPCCINPDHLFLGTQEDNMQDMKEKGRRLGINAGIYNGRAKLTMRQIREIRVSYTIGMSTQTDLADLYGVSQYAISKIVRNERYVE